MAGSDNRFDQAQLLSAAFDPIIDICVLLGVNTAELESLLRVEFVRRVADTLPRASKTKKLPNREQVGLVAGLNRGEVQDILFSGGTAARQRMKKKSQLYSKSDRVLDLWKTESRFMNSSGGPLSLPIENQLGGPSFEELVAKALPTAKYKNVLKDLKRRGLIQSLPDDIVRIRRVPRPATELNSESLGLIAAQMRTAGDTILKAILEPEVALSNQVALYAVSEPIVVAADGLDALRASLQEHIANFLRDVQKETARNGKAKKGKDTVVLETTVYVSSQP